MTSHKAILAVTFVHSPYVNRVNLRKLSFPSILRLSPPSTLCMLLVVPTLVSGTEALPRGEQRTPHGVYLLILRQVTSVA